MKRNDLVKTLIIMLSTVIATVGLAILLNLHTAPIIEANKAGATNDLLLTVMPDAAGFEELYNSENPSASKLTVLPQTIVLDGKYEDKYTEGTSGNILSVYKETSGKGFVFRFEMITQFSTAPMEYTVGVNAEGKIIKINQDIYTESKTVGSDFISSFEGNDSTLAGVELVATVSFSSAAIETAVETGLLLLADNNLIQAGVKSDDQILEELLPKVFPGFIKGSDLPASGNIYKAYKSLNNTGVVCFVNKGESKLLAITNVSEVVTVYQLKLIDEAEGTYELENVTEANSDVVTEVSAFVSGKVTTTYAALTKKLGQMFGEGIEFTELQVNGVGVITSAASFTMEEKVYYAYLAKPINGYERDTMSVYVVLDSEGKIYKFTTGTYFYGDIEYFPPANNFNKNEFESSLGGVTSEDYDGSQTLISGATHTTDAINLSIKGAFAEFAAKGGNE